MSTLNPGSDLLEGPLPTPSQPMHKSPTQAAQHHFEGLGSLRAIICAMLFSRLEFDLVSLDYDEEINLRS